MAGEFHSTTSHQLVLKQFTGEVVRHNVGRDEFFTLLVSRRPLERCDDEPAHRCGLLDPETGDLFGIDEVELHSRS